MFFAFFAIVSAVIEDFRQNEVVFRDFCADIDAAALKKEISPRTVRDAKKELGVALKSKIIEGKRRSSGWSNTKSDWQKI